MKPTLFVLAAGMGSRYGGLKQLDGVGPSGETIMDFSIFDAIRGGFGKVVFVIRKDFENDFREKIICKYENHVPVELVFQAIDDLPEGFTAPADRAKPWGTNHAVLMGKNVINEPFAVINADDYYGRDSFAVLAQELMSKKEGVKGDYAMVGYRVGNTLSESGSVARGVCATSEDRLLTDVVERTAIERIDGAISFTDENGEVQTLEENTPVSMNMWGFTPDYFEYSERIFKEFLATELNNPKAEFFIPLAINELINSGEATVKVLDTTSKWFGVTYAQDRPSVVEKLQALVDAGEYPSPLFK
ncbi:MAG: nucleotidyltransferase [Rikenellaceae bacterium]